MSLIKQQILTYKIAVYALVNGDITLHNRHIRKKSDIRPTQQYYYANPGGLARRPVLDSGSHECTPSSRLVSPTR